MDENTKTIDQFTPQTVMSQNDKIAFWKTGTGKTSNITFADFMKYVRADLAVDGIIGKINDNYYRFKPDDQGVWIIVQDLGTIYPI